MHYVVYNETKPTSTEKFSLAYVSKPFCDNYQIFSKMVLDTLVCL
jgi:hypothetical protein